MDPRMYFMPGLRVNPMMMNRPIFRGINGINLFSRIGNTLRSVKWKELINGANKTLTTVNQTIPLIRQAKPMYDNVKSMVNLARAFGNETRGEKKHNNFRPTDNNKIKNYYYQEIKPIKKNEEYNNTPTFFI